MSNSNISRFPGSISNVDYKQLLKTKDAMNTRKMNVDYFYGIRNATKIEFFNTRLHKKMTYQVLKSIPSVSVFVYSQYIYRLPIFPRFTVSFLKQKMIYKIGNLPIEIIRIINEYTFERFEEVCYSLFYLSVEVYRLFDLNISIINSISRKNIDTRIRYEDNNEDPYNENWIWGNVISSLRMSARNCYICGGYKNTNTVDISQRVLCRCITPH